MPTISYSVKYRKNEGLLMTPEELEALYFYGIVIRSQDGTTITTDTIRAQIRSAQQEIEKFLEIRLAPKFIEHNVSYYRDDYWQKFPILKVKLPVTKPLSLTGFLNGIEQIRYPQTWLNTKKDNEGSYHKLVHIIPTGAVNANSSGSVLLTGITAYYGLTAFNDIPNYFDIQYVTGFEADKLPFDIMDLIGKFAAIKLFHIAGDLILGAGISSLSLGIDGLSQSVSTTSSATNAGYGARIIGYIKDIDNTLKRLKGYYRGFTATAL